MSCGISHLNQTQATAKCLGSHPSGTTQKIFGICLKLNSIEYLSLATGQSACWFNNTHQKQQTSVSPVRASLNERYKTEQLTQGEKPIRIFINSKVLDGLIGYTAQGICEAHYLVHQMFASLQRIIHLCLTWSPDHKHSGDGKLNAARSNTSNPNGILPVARLVFRLKPTSLCKQHSSFLQKKKSLIRLISHFMTHSWTWFSWETVGQFPQNRTEGGEQKFEHCSI